MKGWLIIALVASGIGYWIYQFNFNPKDILIVPRTFPSIFSSPTATEKALPSSEPFTTVAQPANSGIKGMVTVGPTCPVVRNPPQSGCEDKPLETKLTVTQNGRFITSFNSNKDGSFSVNLTAGTYVIAKGTSAFYPTLSPKTVVVKSKQFTRITLEFDSGIR